MVRTSPALPSVALNFRTVMLHKLVLLHKGSEQGEGVHISGVDAEHAVDAVDRRGGQKRAILRMDRDRSSIACIFESFFAVERDLLLFEINANGEILQEQVAHEYAVLVLGQGSVDDGEQLVRHGESANVDGGDLYHPGSATAPPPALRVAEPSCLSPSRLGQAGRHQVAGTWCRRQRQRALPIDGGFKLDTVPLCGHRNRTSSLRGSDELHMPPPLTR